MYMHVNSVYPLNRSMGPLQGPNKSASPPPKAEVSYKRIRHFDGISKVNQLKMPQSGSNRSEPMG